MTQSLAKNPPPSSAMSIRVSKETMPIKFIRILLPAFLLNAVVFAQTHDGRWWQSTLEDQRNEYLNGYMDCAVYDGGRRDLPSVGIVKIAQAIQSFYDSHSKSLGTPVVTVLDLVSKQKGMHPMPLTGGEVWTNKHGYYDGEYWPSSDVERANVTCRFLQRLALLKTMILCSQHYVLVQQPETQPSIQDQYRSRARPLRRSKSRVSTTQKLRSQKKTGLSHQLNPVSFSALCAVLRPS